jgi:energy-coupling factor transporter transmembrane protein EcfT
LLLSDIADRFDASDSAWLAMLRMLCMLTLRALILMSSSKSRELSKLPMRD